VNSHCFISTLLVGNGRHQLVDKPSFSESSFGLPVALIGVNAIVVQLFQISSFD